MSSHVTVAAVPPTYISAFGSLPTCLQRAAFTRDPPFILGFWGGASTSVVAPFTDTLGWGFLEELEQFCEGGLFGITEAALLLRTGDTLSDIGAFSEFAVVFDTCLSVSAAPPFDVTTS